MKLTITDKTLYGLILLGIMLMGCLNNVTDGWTRAGLEGEYINSLKTDQGQLYAATRMDLYQKSFAGLSGAAAWQSLGIKHFIDGRAVRDFIVFSEQEILAGVGSFSEFKEGTIPLWRTTTGGKSWEPYQNGFGEENSYNAFTGIDATPTRDTLFAASGAVARSTDRGENWEPVLRNWSTVPVLLFVTVDRQNPQNIWSGGRSFVYEAQLIKSTDYGETWSYLDPYVTTEATVHDLVIHPSNSDKVMAGMVGGVRPANVIRRSTDGGQSWQTVLEGFGVRALAQSPRDGSRVYASGNNTSGTLFFAKTDDFGDTWELVEHEDGPAGIWVNDLAAVEQNGREILYFGTNKGVYSYTFID